MLQNFIVCVNAVIPSTIFLIIGIILKCTNVVTQEEVRRFTKVIFVTLYPFMMFDNLYGKNLLEFFNPRIIIFVLTFLTCIVLFVCFVVCKIEKENYNRGAMVQAIFRSNIVLMGIPIASNLLGKSNITSVAVVLLFAVTFYNVASVLVLEFFRKGKPSVLKIAKNVLKNPLILGAIAAIVVMMLKIELPQPVVSAISDLNTATTPVALILLGASLNKSGLKEERKRVAVCTIGKLIIVPVIGITTALLIGITGAELVAITLMVGTPTALASYAMATSMDSNGSLAGEVVVFTTLLSCITLPIWLFLLKIAGMF